MDISKINYLIAKEGKLGLRRHATDSRKQQAYGTILRELNGSGQNLGYRSMTRRLASAHGIVVSRETVRSILHSVDPDNVELRRKRVIDRRSYINKGPNFLVHIDGYDKLKRYGFPIHAAIDGFSRRLFWLEAVVSNNNPRIVATLFLKYIREIKGVPRCVRMDAGTENTLVEDIQKAFRHEHTDDMAGSKSVIKGSSPSNQRIERWWRSGRQGGFQYWIELFANMESDGYLSTSDTLHIGTACGGSLRCIVMSCGKYRLTNSCYDDMNHGGVVNWYHPSVECMRFCFWDLLQTDLDVIRADWNQHRIRHSRGADSLGGKPDILYHMPHLFGRHDYKTVIDEHDLEEVHSLYAVQSWRGCSDWFRTEMSHRSIQIPSTVDEAIILFRRLTSLFGH